MSEEKYFGNLEELETALLASPFWRKSGEGKYTAAQYHVLLELVEDYNLIILVCQAWPVDIRIEKPLHEICLCKDPWSTYIYFTGEPEIKLILEWKKES